MTTIMNPRAGSPVSDNPSDCAMDSLSKSDKVLLKHSLPHNNNLKVGYMPVNESDIPKAGLRGRKTFAFWTLVSLLFLLAVGNLILTFTILGVLRLGQGMESLELVPEASVIKFYGNTDLDRLYKRDGKIDGFSNAPVEVIGDNGSILLNLVKGNHRPVNKVRIDKNGTVFKGLRKFEIKNVFSTELPNMKINKNIDGLSVKKLSTNRIASSIDEDLNLKAGSTASLRGTEGVNMESKKIILSADQDIFLRTNGSLILNGNGGIFIDVKNIPIASGNYPSYASSDYKVFKVCVCMPQGKLFRVLVPPGLNARVSCIHVKHNPCI